MMVSDRIMLDQPDKYAVGGAAAYGLFSYVLIPFVLYWLSFGFNGDPNFRFIGQLTHYVINFAVALWLFRVYLRDAFITVQAETKKVMSIVAWFSVDVAAYFIILWSVAPNLNGQFWTDLLLGLLPIGEVDLLLFGADFIYVSPVVGSLVFVLLTPVTTTCLYYAMSFAPVCYKKPWLAYIVVALVLAIPRVINSILFWSIAQEFAIYLGQLPIHLLVCRAYQKCDTVWAPIFCLMAANLLACLFLLFFVL